MRVTDNHYILDRKHPYLGAMDLSYCEVFPGLWRVKWRDFLMVKQDCDFPNEQEAKDFHDKIWLNAHRVNRSLLDDACTNFQDASEICDSLA